MSGRSIQTRSKTKRPAFLTMWKHFATVYGDGSVVSVGKTIGGKVQQNIELGRTDPVNGFTNACAIRLSYSLNHSGAKIARGNWKTVSGADRSWHIYRVRDLRTYLKATFGDPDKTMRKPKSTDFSKLQGIIVFDVADWNDASGHATLWNGSTCSDHCYFAESSEAALWLLP